MAGPKEHLRADVFWSTTEGVRFLRVLGQPEVRKLEVTISSQENVLWFEISIDNIALVEVAEG